jgi:hypothetical protein
VGDAGWAGDGDVDKGLGLAGLRLAFLLGDAIVANSVVIQLTDRGVGASLLANDR